MANCVVQFSTVAISQCPKTCKLIVFLSLLYVIRGIYVKTILNLVCLTQAVCNLSVALYGKSKRIKFSNYSKCMEKNLAKNRGAPPKSIRSVTSCRWRVVGDELSVASCRWRVVCEALSLTSCRWKLLEHVDMMSVQAFVCNNKMADRLWFRFKNLAYLPSAIESSLITYLYKRTAIIRTVQILAAVATLVLFYKNVEAEIYPKM